MTRRRDARLDILLGSAPILKSGPGTDAKDMLPRRAIGGDALRLCPQDRQRRLRQRDEVLALVLGAGRWQGNERIVEVDFAPAQMTSIIRRFGLRLDDSFSGDCPPGAGSAAGSAFISTR